MNKTLTTVWMALALPLLQDPGKIAPLRTLIPATAPTIPHSENGASSLSDRREVPLLIRILLTPPPDLRTDRPDLEELRRAELFYSVQQ